MHFDLLVVGTGLYGATIAHKTLYLQYKELAALETKLVFDRRLGEYRYYDMDPVVKSALKTAETRW